MVPKRPHDAYDMNVKVNALWGNISIEEKKSERPKVRRSIMHSIRKLTGETETLGGKGVMRSSSYDLKPLGD